MYFNISVFFVVYNTSILKMVFPITYCFCLDSHLSACVVVIIVVSFIVAYYCNLSLLLWLSSFLLLLLYVSYFAVNFVNNIGFNDAYFNFSLISIYGHFV